MYGTRESRECAAGTPRDGNVQDSAVLLDCGERLPAKTLEESLPAVALRNFSRARSGAARRWQIFPPCMEIPRADGTLRDLGNGAAANSAAAAGGVHQQQLRP